MEDNHSPIEDANAAHNPSGNMLPPFSFFPTELSRLGLAHGDTPGPSQVNGLLTALNSRDWQVRLAAIHALGKLEARAPLDPLLAALNDEDSSVRAAAVHALGALKERAPLTSLQDALHDPAWQVRESAVLALGKLSRPVPGTWLVNALNDSDASVREAAQLASHWNATTAAARPDAENWPHVQESGQGRGVQVQKMEYSPQPFWSDGFDYGDHRERSQALEEYGSEHEPYQDGYELPDRWEKVTPRRKKPRTGLVIALSGFAAVLILSAVFGTLSFLMQRGVSVVAQPRKIAAQATPVGKNLPVSPPFADYTMFGFNAQHTGFNSSEHTLSTANVSSLVTAWDVPAGGFNTSSPVEANGVIYVAAVDQHVRAFDANTGALLWSAPTGGENATTPAVGAGAMVYVNSQDGKLYAFGQKSGQQNWVAASGGTWRSSPTVADGMVYVGSNNDNVYAFNAQTGALQWTAHTKGPVDNAPAVAGGLVYVGSYDKNLYAFDAQTGALRWQAPTDGGETTGSPAINKGIVYVSTSADIMEAFDAQTGALLWRVPGANGSQSTPAIANGVIYIIPLGGILHALDAKTGKQLWSFNLQSPCNFTPTVANGVIYAGAEVGELDAINAATGAPLWRYGNPGVSCGFSSPIVSGGTVYTGWPDGNLYAFRLSGNASQPTPTPPPMPSPTPSPSPTATPP